MKRKIKVRPSQSPTKETAKYVGTGAAVGTASGLGVGLVRRHQILTNAAKLAKKRKKGAAVAAKELASRGILSPRKYAKIGLATGLATGAGLAYRKLKD